MAAHAATVEQSAVDHENRPEKAVSTTYAELRAEISDRSNGSISSITVDSVIRKAVEAISQRIMTGYSVSIPGLGKFAAVTRKERAGVNPRTGEKMTIPARRSVQFRPAKALKDQINDWW